MEVLLLAAAGVLVVRAVQLSGDERGQRQGLRQLGAALRLAPSRGRISDRHGKALAVTVLAPSVYANPAAVDDPDATARALGRALGTAPGPLRERLRRRGPFVFLARWLSEDTARCVRELDLPGVGLVSEPRRVYPLGELAGALLGFANIDGVGVRGIERLEDPWLRGRRLAVAVERDARGRLLAGPGVDPRVVGGGEVRLTLDVALQALAESALAEAIQSSGAREGFALTLDSGSGELLAAAEWPAFDPNLFRQTSYAAARSRTFVDALEPGSVVKAFLAAAALDAGVVDREESFEVADGVRFPGKWIRDPVPRESLDLAGILRVSSNAGAVRIGERLGARRLHAALRRFGFGARTGSGFPEESVGLLRDWQYWQPLDQAAASFGQGFGVTPIQLAAATAALAADGVWRPPVLVRARRNGAGPWRPEPVPPSRRAVSEAVAAAVAPMLAAVVEGEGTGRRAALRGLRVAGKTGTSQKFDLVAGRYSRTLSIAWFAGFAPVESPRLVIVVGLDEPDPERHAQGHVAAELFARVAAAQLGHLGIPTEPVFDRPITADPTATAATTDLHGAAVAIAQADAAGGAPPAAPTLTPAAPTLTPAAASATPPSPSPPPAPSRPSPQATPTPPGPWLLAGGRVFVPDLRGLQLADLRRFFTETAIPVHVEGRGRVVAQDPGPGSVMPVTGSALRVRLEGPHALR